MARSYLLQHPAASAESYPLSAKPNPPSTICKPPSPPLPTTQELKV